MLLAIKNNSVIIKLLEWRGKKLSMQSDVESLSIQALENYAKIHNLSENDAIDETSVVDFIVLY